MEVPHSISHNKITDVAKNVTINCSSTISVNKEGQNESICKTGMVSYKNVGTNKFGTIFVDYRKDTNAGSSQNYCSNIEKNKYTQKIAPALQKMQSCTICCTTFKDKPQLNLHMQFVHKINIKNNININCDKSCNIKKSANQQCLGHPIKTLKSIPNKQQKCPTNLQVDSIICKNVKYIPKFCYNKGTDLKLVEVEKDIANITFQCPVCKISNNCIQKMICHVKECHENYKCHGNLIATVQKTIHSTCNLCCPKIMPSLFNHNVYIGNEALNNHLIACHQYNVRENIITLEVRKYICLHCNVSFNIKDQAVYHNHEVHLDEQILPRNIFTKKYTLFACHLCFGKLIYKYFSSKNDIEKHIANSHSKTEITIENIITNNINLKQVSRAVFQCNVCIKLFTNINYTKQHQILCHANVSQLYFTITSLQLFSCTVCSDLTNILYFRSLHAINLHMKNCHESKSTYGKIHKFETNKSAYYKLAKKCQAVTENQFEGYNISNNISNVTALSNDSFKQAHKNCEPIKKTDLTVIYCNFCSPVSHFNNYHQYQDHIVNLHINEVFTLILSQEQHKSTFDSLLGNVCTNVIPIETKDEKINVAKSELKILNDVTKEPSVNVSSNNKNNLLGDKNNLSVNVMSAENITSMPQCNKLSGENEEPSKSVNMENKDPVSVALSIPVVIDVKKEIVDEDTFDNNEFNQFILDNLKIEVDEDGVMEYEMKQELLSEDVASSLENSVTEKSQGSNISDNVSNTFSSSIDRKWRCDDCEQYFNSELELNTHKNNNECDEEIHLRKRKLVCNDLKLFMLPVVVLKRMKNL